MQCTKGKNERQKHWKKSSPSPNNMNVGQENYKQFTTGQLIFKILLIFVYKQLRNTNYSEIYCAESYVHYGW